MTKNNRNFSNTISNITTELARLEARVALLREARSRTSFSVRHLATRREYTREINQLEEQIAMLTKRLERFRLGK
jgi:ubiquinone biosynthesis protein UbiJ